MPKYYFTFESLQTAAGRVPVRNREQIADHIKGNLEIDPVTDKNLTDTFQKDFKGVKNPLRSNEEQAVSRELAENARQRMIYIAGSIGESNAPDGIEPYIAQMFLSEVNEENIQKNNELKKAIEDDNTQMQVQLYEAYVNSLTELPGYKNPQIIAELSNEDIIWNFDKYYKLYLAATSARELLLDQDPDGFASKLSEDTRKKMEQLVLALPLYEAMKNRMEAFANPYYERVDVDKLIQAKEADKGFENITTNKNYYEGFRIFGQKVKEMERVRKISDLMPAYNLSRELHEKGYDLNTLRICDTKNREYSLRDFHRNGGVEALNSGLPLIFIDGKGKKEAYYQKDGKLSFTNPQILISNDLNDVFTTRVEKLTALATGSVADPFWMATGSSEYRDLKTALEQHAAVVKAVGNPPKEEALEALQNSLESLGAAARKYLTKKDLMIKDNVSFETYKETLGEALNMNKRELARLEAAFTARDLVRDTQAAIALSRTLEMKNEQVISVDQAFYQGLLRKYAQLDHRMNEYFDKQNDEATADPEFEAKMSEALTDEDMLISAYNPYPGDELKTLLWEMRQMTDLIGRTEQAMGLRASQRKIDPQLQVKAKSDHFFGGKDPAQMSVQDLRDVLDGAVQSAKQKKLEEQEKAVSKEDYLYLDYGAKEFHVDKKIFESDIAASNDSKEIQTFLNENKGSLSSSTKKHLEHRIKSMKRIEELEKAQVGHPPKETYTLTRDGKTVSGPIQPGDKIMLLGVHERRSQNTMNGCWSVSLCSQLEYRGIHLTQEQIRAYRPISDDSSVGDPSYYYKNRKQSMADYRGMIGRLLPNTQSVQYAYKGELGLNPAEIRNTLRQMVLHALTKDNSPVSLCAGGHYITIVGMEGDTFYVKNPMHIFGGNPETIEKWTMDDIMKKGKNTFEVNWLRDVKPTLGGSVKSEGFGDNGLYYAGGRMHSYLIDEKDKTYTRKNTLGHDGFATFTDERGGNPVQRYVRLGCPPLLHYKKLPGCDYNADALKVMNDELSKVYRGIEDSYPEVRFVLDEVEKLQQGKYAATPEKGMLALAKNYQDALKALKEKSKEDPSELNRTLTDMLSRHLTDVKTAIMDMRNEKYKRLIGDETQRISYGDMKKNNEMTAAANEKRRIFYTEFKEGLSGILYLHAVKEIDLEDPTWIKALEPKEVENGAKKIQNSKGFKQITADLVDNANKYASLITGNKGLLKELEPDDEVKKEEPKKEEPKAVKKVPAMGPSIKEKVDAFETMLSNQKELEKMRNAEMLEQHRREIVEKNEGDYEIFAKPKKSFQDTKSITMVTKNVESLEPLRLDLLNGNIQKIYKQYLDFEKAPTNVPDLPEELVDEMYLDQRNRIRALRAQKEGEKSIPQPKEGEYQRMREEQKVNLEKRKAEMEKKKQDSGLVKK